MTDLCEYLKDEKCTNPKCTSGVCIGGYYCKYIDEGKGWEEKAEELIHKMPVIRGVPSGYVAIIAQALKEAYQQGYDDCAIKYTKAIEGAVD